MNILIYILLSIIGVICGCLTNILINKSKCNGKLYIDGNDIYLALSQTDLEKFKHRNYITLEIHRKNFKCFNEK